MATAMPKKGKIATILRQRTLEAMMKAGMTTEQIRRAMPEGKVETTQLTLAQKALETLRARAAKVPEFVEKEAGTVEGAVDPNEAISL
jgi:hypothetical protein